MVEGSLEVKLPTIWTDEKKRWEDSEKRREEKRREGKGREEKRREEKRREEERRSQKRKSQKKEDEGARKGRKVAKHCVFPMVCNSGGSKSRLAKAAGAEPVGQMRDEKLHALVARSTFRSQNAQSTHGLDHFWKLRCRKSARRCGTKHNRSQNLQTTAGSDHFWKLRCRKSAGRCGAKYISKPRCTKHTRFGQLLEVAMSKKCTPLWREARFEVKTCKTHHVRTTFGRCDVEKVYVVVARSTFRIQNVKKSRGWDHFWTFRCAFAWQAQGIVDFVKSEQNVRVLQHLQKQWQAWNIRKGSAKMHFPSQAQYKRHVWRFGR